MNNNHHKSFPRKKRSASIGFSFWEANIKKILIVTASIAVLAVAAFSATQVRAGLQRGQSYTQGKHRVVIYRDTWGEVVEKDVDPVRRLIQRKIGDKLGIDLVMKTIPGTEYGQKLEVDLSIGEQIDAFVTGADDLSYWYSREGIIEPLTSLLQEYGQHILARTPQAAWDQVRIGKTILAIPAYSDPGGQSIVVRQDILDRYGLKLPRTIAKLEEVSARLRRLDPSIVPITGAWWDFSYLLCPALGIKRWDEHIIDNKRKMIYTGNKDLDFYRYFATIRRWYREGYLDPDFLSANFDNMRTMFLHGKNVFSFNNVERANDWGLALHTINPHGKITVIPQLNNAGVWAGSGPVPEVMILTQYSKYKRQVVQYMDWLFTDRANYTLASLGIEGVHYRADGKNGFLQLPATTYRNVFAPIFNKNLALTCRNRYPDWYPAYKATSSVKWETDPLKGKLFLDTSIEKKYPKIASFDQEWAKFLDGRLEPTRKNYERVVSLYFDNGGTQISHDYYRQYLASRK